jgi:hypothetical protein
MELEVAALTRVVTLDVFWKKRIQKTSFGHVRRSACSYARLRWPSARRQPFHQAVSSGGQPAIGVAVHHTVHQSRLPDGLADGMRLAVIC